MPLVSNDPSWWPFINASRISSYFVVAAFAGGMYDWVFPALTFGKEVELIWKRRWSLVTFLYISAHYLGMLWIVTQMLSSVPTITVTDVILILLGVVFLLVNIANIAISAIITNHTISGEELILSGTYQCIVNFESDTMRLSSMTWILGTVWEVFALCLAVWIAVKHFQELRRQLTGGILEDCFTVLMKSHVGYFVSFVAVSCFELSYEMSTMPADLYSLEVQIYAGFRQIFMVVHLFVLGPRLILVVREYHAELMDDSDAATAMTSIAFQEREHVSTSSSV
ncbi:uncharacterized protein EDB91DRAFT_1255841 [Suillus paluster]|uniref:uncharacterized protein n=1 Tax=Suillus paluster TaxID=48578 RepID=UPI001B86E83B|nr:uncharacterized protein EDB91DRAFT_1255841 [Suillus paluster]KAG1722926.1 hypothetical protein EDB91DRAFT_1255841 [Suillus paluster]